MKPLQWVKHAAEGLLALCLLGMVVAVFGNVVLRYVWGTGWVVSEELSRLLFVWLVSVAATLTFAEGKHLGFDLVTARLTGRLAAAMRWLTRGLMALALYYLITGAWAQVVVGMDSRSPVMNYPLALGAGAIFLMGVCMAVLLALQAAAELRGDNRPDNQGDGA
jgi:TRAP-type C4-dicarboxylate transport system permease small subunit